MSAGKSADDLIVLSSKYNLYLKPIWRISINVQVPSLKNSSVNKAISNWEVMEKLRIIVKPIEFNQLKVLQSTFEIINFQAELDSRSDMNEAITSLESKVIKLSGFPDNLRVKANPIKITYPSRHHWESFFREADDMDKRTPGERPDTIYISGLPIRWFSDLAKIQNNSLKPSRKIFKSVFEIFGSVRTVDIPILDPSRRSSTQNQTTFFHEGQLGLTFDGFVQYKDYVGFVRGMDALRGMKVVYRLNIPNPGQPAGACKLFMADIKIDFDRNRHLSESSIRKRKQDKQLFLEDQKRQRVDHEEMEKLRLEEEEKKREAERQRLIEEKIERQRLKEQKRQEKLEMKRRQEELEMQKKIALEERKIMIAKRKLESIRLLAALLNIAKGRKRKDFEEKESTEPKRPKQTPIRANNDEKSDHLSLGVKKFQPVPSVSSTTHIEDGH